MDTKKLIDSLGGIRAVATSLDVSETAVGNWRMESRGIPWKHRPGIARIATEKAVSLPMGFWYPSDNK